MICAEKQPSTATRRDRSLLDRKQRGWSGADYGEGRLTPVTGSTGATVCPYESLEDTSVVGCEAEAA